VSEVDTEGRGPTFVAGDRVYMMPLKAWATVERQRLSYDCGETFWGNVLVTDESGQRREFSSWQLSREAKC